jgi:hypothetical protein
LTCARGLAETWGLRIWRRPLDESEILSSLELYQNALTLGETPNDALKHMLRGWLSSLPFLFRMELDAQPDDPTPRALNGYELASRLSYLLWSSVPDDPLFDSALQGKLDGNSDDAQLQAELERLLADPKSSAFVTHYGQWLGIDRVANRAFNAAQFPSWSSTLANAMLNEGYSYLNEFLRNDLPLSEFFTHDVNFVNAELATHYGFGQANNDLTRVEDTSDLRRGFLGLGTFLASTSFDTRTSPSLRGRRTLELLCVQVPSEPPDLNFPPVEPEPSEPTENIRARLEAAVAPPQCKACHAVFDPFGLAMENFDAVGHYRESYSNGEPIDPTAVLSDGTVLNNFTDLTAMLSADPRFVECATEKLFMYAQGRRPMPQEVPFLQRIHDEALADGGSLKALLQRLVLSEPFRNRHAAAPTSPPSYL